MATAQTGTQQLRTYSASSLQELLGDHRLIMASNRGPIEYYSEANRLRSRRGSGGVVTALSNMAQHTRLTWVASAMTDADRLVGKLGIEPDHSIPNMKIRFVTTSAESYHQYYNIISNPTLWFLQHQMIDVIGNEVTEDALLHAWTNGYVEINKAFARVIAQEAATTQTSPVIMLHDYHLYVAPHFLRTLIPHALLHHFIHIPWPAPEYWQLLPATIRTTILSGLCSNDIVGFQTSRSRHQFLATCDEYLPSARVDFADEKIKYRNHICKARVYPISIDCGQVMKAAHSSSANQHVSALTAPQHMRTIVRVDRVDPTKNIVIGYHAFARMLENHPEMIGNVRFLSFLVPCRDEIVAYQQYTSEVFRLVAEINDRYGKPGYQPIEVYYQNNYEHALAGMRLYDVLLVNPVQDGMNLVAKEGPLVNERNGIVVLSREAGAYSELAPGVVPVSPLDITDTADKLYSALTMPEQERRSLAAFLRHQVQTNDIESWLLAQFKDIHSLQPPIIATHPSLNIRNISAQPIKMIPKITQGLAPGITAMHTKPLA